MTTINVPISNFHRVLFAVCNGYKSVEAVADATNLPVELVHEYAQELSKPPFNLITIREYITQD
tara:strand:+ start:1845 stop:2036 length:192 start_codon:yes stop_codon:yes gene_type:complete